MDSPGSKRVLACIRCSDKRIKCNRQTPCANCIKHNSECEYRLRKPRARRNEAQADVKKSTKNFEALTPARSDSATPEHIDKPCSGFPGESSRLWRKEIEDFASEPQETVFKTQLLQSQDGTRLVDNSLWSRVAEEIHSDDDHTEDPTPNGIDRNGLNHDDFSYILGGTSSEIKFQHPRPAQIRQLWQIFVENVDPLLKITHVPTLQPSIEKAISNIEHIPEALGALLFSIYSMAVLSITEDDCRKTFGFSRAQALEHFIAATRSALVIAGFMSTTSLMVMQALTLHIFSIRQLYEPRAVWNLTGLALRVAQGMGLCIDGTLLGLSPFETEIRRRLWWQLKSHDFRAAELCGQAKFQQFELTETTPKAPANVNDSDLYPSMKEAPVGSKGVTEMIWNVLRTELATFAAYHKFKITHMKNSGKATGLRSEEYSALDNLSAKDEMSNEIEELVETKYLRYCDPSKPLHLLMHLGARCATDHIRFIAHHPRRWAHQKEVPKAEKDLVWNLCLQILDRTMMMQSMPQLKRFAWIVPYFVQWPTIIHILDTLRLEPCHQDAAKAWELIDSLYRMNSEMLFMKRPIFTAVGSLCWKAHQSRLKLEPQSLDMPDYMAKLQERHLNRKKREGKNVSNPKAREAKGLELLKISAKPAKPPTETQFGLLPVSESDNGPSCWPKDDLASIQDSETPYSLEMDIDANGFLISNDWLETLQGAAINWEQWDTWLGNS